MHTQRLPRRKGVHENVHPNAHHTEARQWQQSNVCTAHVENLLEKGRHDCREWKTRAGQCCGLGLQNWQRETCSAATQSKQRKWWLKCQHLKNPYIFMLSPNILELRNSTQHTVSRDISYCNWFKGFSVSGIVQNQAPLYGARKTFFCYFWCIWMHDVTRF